MLVRLCVVGCYRVCECMWVWEYVCVCHQVLIYVVSVNISVCVGVSHMGMSVDLIFMSVCVNVCESA